MAAAVGTWTVSAKALEICQQILTIGGSALDAVTSGISVVEDDHNTGPYIVGCGGCPNAEGVLQCDAAIMCGENCQFGAVVAIEGVRTPIQVARRVLEKAPPAILVAAGATEFARKEGFNIEDNDTLLGPESLSAYKKWREQKCNISGHDTLGVIAKDCKGHLVAGVSTSGLPYKTPGRVGDSPLPGGGLCADNPHGAATCTGDGDLMLRFCPTQRAVTLMSHGSSPQQACELVVGDISKRLNQSNFFMGIIALNREGSLGAAGTVKTWTDPVTKTVYDGFPYCTWREASEESAPSIHVMPCLPTIM